jgi:hypothetical protein
MPTAPAWTLIDVEKVGILLLSHLRCRFEVFELFLRGFLAQEDEFATSGAVRSAGAPQRPPLRQTLYVPFSHPHRTATAGYILTFYWAPHLSFLMSSNRQSSEPSTRQNRLAWRTRSPRSRYAATQHDRSEQSTTAGSPKLSTDVLHSYSRWDNLIEKCCGFVLEVLVQKAPIQRLRQ